MKPHKLEDLIFNKRTKEQLDEIIRHIRNGTPVLIWGQQGIGKTSFAKLVSKKFNFNVYYTNASSERTKKFADRILAQVQRRTLHKSILILDEVDGFKNWSTLKKIIKQTKIPIILIANDIYKNIPKEIREMCSVYEFKPPYVTSARSYIRKLAESKGVPYDANKVNRDLRASVNTVLHGGDNYDITDNFNVTREALEGRYEHFRMGEHFVWLWDNIPAAFNGFQLYQAINASVLASRTKRKQALEVFMPKRKSVGMIDFPSWFRMLKYAKKKEA